MRRTRRRTNLRRKRTYRKPRIARQLRIASSTNFLNVVRKVNLGPITHLVSSGWVAYPYTFKATDLPNYSEYQALFDYYKINAVKLTFIPYFTDADIQAQGTTNPYAAQPRLYTIIDRNGIAGGTIANEDRMLEYANARLVKNPLKPFSIYVKRPAVEVAVEGVVAGGAAASTSLNMRSRWLDTGVGNTPHFGCAVGWIQPGTIGTLSMTYHVVATYYLQFKHIN